MWNTAQFQRNLKWDTMDGEGETPSLSKQNEMDPNLVLGIAYMTRQHLFSQGLQVQAADKIMFY